MKAYIFPGQGSQFVGMGKDLYDSNSTAKKLFEAANEILNFKITDTMFSGTVEDLKQTKVTQPAIFLHSVILAKVTKPFNPDMVAGHSLGEFSALVANNTLEFKDGLNLVYQRALAMQDACEKQPSTMAAVLGLNNDIIEEVCYNIDEIVVTANYNCPGQVVISGTIEGINRACEELKSKGAKRAIVLPVGGAFHSPLMDSAKKKLAQSIENTKFNNPICPVYQNVNAKSVTDIKQIKTNLINQLTAPVLWTQTVQKMVEDGATHFIECGPGKVLQGLVRKINSESLTNSLA